MLRGLAWSAFLLLMASTLTDALIPQVSSVGVRDNQPVQVGRNLIGLGKVLLEGLPASISADKDSESRGTFLSFKTNTVASEHLVQLGSLSCNRFLACSRQKLWWMNPSWGDVPADIPAETQFLLFQLKKPVLEHRENTEEPPEEEEYEYGVIFPLISGAFRASLEAATPCSSSSSSINSNMLCLRIESGDSLTASGEIGDIVFVGTGTDPFAVVAEGFQAVQKRLKTFKLRRQKVRPGSIDKFGWCTWDAFYTNVDGAGILRGVEALTAGGVPPHLLIIDDGWQDTSNAPRASAGRALLWALTGYYERVVSTAPRDSWHIKVWRALSSTILRRALLDDYERKYDFAKRLKSLHASDRFLGTLEAGSLARFIAKLKREHGIREVYCWHALAGYWSGIHVPPSGPGEHSESPLPSETAGAVKGSGLQADLSEAAAALQGSGLRDLGAEFVDSGLEGSGLTGSGLEDLEIAIHTPVPTSGALQVEPRLSWDALTLKGVGLASPRKQFELYSRMHAYLASAQVDGVKVDVQAAATMLGEGRGGSVLATRTMLQAMEQSVALHFGSQNCINCMCHPIECLYAYNQTNIARASDDFYPREPASHTLHIANVAYNSLFLGELVYPDWDMFQSSNAVGTLHGVARAVSGCAVYVSDRPGEHDFTLLRRIVLPDGSVLPALQPGKPTRDCLFSDVTRDGRSACKIWNRNPCGGGVVAAFNLQGSHWDRERRCWASNAGPTDAGKLASGVGSDRAARLELAPPAVCAAVSPADCEAPLPDCKAPQPGQEKEEDEWALWRTHWASDGAARSQQFALVQRRERREVTLEAKECAVYTFAPVKKAPSRRLARSVKWAVLGLENMFNGGAAVFAAATHPDADALELRVRGEGSLLIYLSERPQNVFCGNVEGVPLEFSYADGEGLLRVVLPPRFQRAARQGETDLGTLLTIPL